MSNHFDAPASGNRSEQDELPPEDLVAVLDAEEAGLVAAYDRLTWRSKVIALAVVVFSLAILLVIWHDVSFRWFEIHTGTINESGPYYGFWSGFGSDIGEATLIVGVFAAWRHHSCHVRGCARLGRQVQGTPYLACPKHHPAHRGSRRTVSLETIEQAHTKGQRD